MRVQPIWQFDRALDGGARCLFPTLTDSVAHLADRFSQAPLQA
jgi:hypothetical protein